MATVCSIVTHFLLAPQIVYSQLSLFFVAALAALTGRCPACADELLKGALLFLDRLRVEKRKECCLNGTKTCADTLGVCFRNLGRSQ
jgi:hypothetical protein